MEAKTSDWRPGPSVCRCCLTEGCYKDISTEYFWMGKKEIYSEMLSDTFSISIAYSQSGPNSNSRLICEPCIARLRDASDFRRQVVECEKTFMQHLDPGTSSSADIEILAETVDYEVKLERVKTEKPLSDDDFDDADFLDDDDDDDMDDEPLTKLASKVPKKESVDLLDLLDNSKPSLKRKSATKVKASPTKKSKTKKDTAKPATSKVTKPEKKKKGTDSSLNEDTKKQPQRIVPLFQVAYDRSLCRPLGTVLDFSKLSELKTNVQNASLLPKTSATRDFTPSRSPSPLSPADSPLLYIQEETTPQVDFIHKPKTQPKAPDVRQNALTVFEFSTIYPFVYSNNKFKCFVCCEPFFDTTLLREHMAEAHTFTAVKRLVNNKRENVLKVDVSDIMCKICTLRPKDLVEMKQHLQKIHEKPIDPDLHDNIIPFNLQAIDGSHKCVICNETFIKVRVLVIHMSVHFNNYSCEFCGSGFMTLRLLKKHLEVHENGNFPCDRCNKVFTTPYKRTLHIRGVHLKQYPRRCPICPERFNSNYKRTIHLQDVHNQSTRVHKCETCGRGFNLKYHLICHTRSVHLQERNQQCDVCFQRFCNKESLKRHMVIHTGEKNHKCDVCGMAFLRRKNLKDHLRLHDMG